MSNSRIHADPRIMGGQPVVAGTRITVSLLLREIARGAGIAEILDQYPHLKDEDVRAALLYASDVVSNDVVVAAE